jgi:hypothetical protein
MPSPVLRTGQSAASGSALCPATRWGIVAEGVICGWGGCRIASRHGERQVESAAPRSSRPDRKACSPERGDAARICYHKEGWFGRSAVARSVGQDGGGAVQCRGDGEVAGMGGGFLPLQSLGHGLAHGLFLPLAEVAQSPVTGGEGLVPSGGRPGTSTRRHQASRIASQTRLHQQLQPRSHRHPLTPLIPVITNQHNRHQRTSPCFVAIGSPRENHQLTNSAHASMQRARHPSSDLLSRPPAEHRLRASERARACKCSPVGGYQKPSLAQTQPTC